MQFALRLDDRREDRVYVAVCLSPEDDVVNVEGVAVELRCRNGQSLSSRLMVPIRGPLAQPLCLATEIRAREGQIPRSARVFGIAWTEDGPRETSCPADPGTALEAYARGSRIALQSDLDEDPTDLTTQEHRAMVRAFPWMDHFRPAEEESPDILDEQAEDLADDIACCYGLCDEDKELIRELLSEDDEDDEDDDEDDELDRMLAELDDEDDVQMRGRC